MSNNKPINSVLMGREHWDVPVRVELQAYLRFNRQFDTQLRRLVARWAYTASPWSRGVPVIRGLAKMPAPPTV